MYNKPNTAIIKDIKGFNDVEFTIKDPQVAKDIIVVTLGGKVAFIDRQKLWDFVFAIVKPDMQRDMLPVGKFEMEKYIKQHSVKLQHDMKAGDILAVNCEVNVRAEIAEAYRRELEEEKTGKLSPYTDK